MTAAVVVTNLAMGAVYLAYGTMTVLDLRSSWRYRSRRFFGIAFMGIMFTCGPHHVEHGLHVWFEGSQGGVLDLIVVVMGLPAGVIWFGLRVEAMRGGAGDRFVEGTPRWMEALPILGAVYLVLAVTATTDLIDADRLDVRVIPNLVIMAMYFAIGSVLLSTQLRNHDVTGGWSTSGLALAGVFLTCALMHLVYAGYGTEGRYVLDGHILVIDILAIPGAALFLALVVGVYRGDVGYWDDDGSRSAERSTPTDGSQREPVAAGTGDRTGA